MLKNSKKKSPLEWLFERQGSGISLGLQIMERLLSALGNPQKKVPVLHIAGTNGKGSVSAIAESILRAAGYRTGLYTSPHLVAFHERIRLQGVSVDDITLEASIHRLQQVTQDWENLPTFFELTTALAFDIFAHQQCDILILETGLGGRLDATNVSGTSKLACAITPIGLDHQALLGETLSLITKEKAGIFRPGIPIVSSPQPEEVQLVLQKKAHEMGVSVQFVCEPLSELVPLGLLGSYQRWNAALAIELIHSAGLKVPEKALKIGLARVSWPGRFQPILLDSLQPVTTNPSALLIFDGAHNPAGAEQLVQTWREVFQEEGCTLIFGALADKDWKKILSVLKTIASEIIFVPVASPRAVPLEELLREIPEAASFPSLKNALDFFRSSTSAANCGVAPVLALSSTLSTFHRWAPSAPGTSSAEASLERSLLENSFDLKKNSEHLSFSDFLKKRKKTLRPTIPSRAPILVTGSLFLVGEALALLEGAPYHSSMQ
jgi:dihydrofolate synthase/folylpolyglutamate synthase